MDGQETNGDVGEENISDDEELIEVIELDGAANGDDEIAGDLDHMELVEDDDEMAEAVPIQDDAKVVFSEHNGSVFSIDVNNESKLAVTGGEDDLAYVWKIETGEMLFKCDGHKDSVVAVGFNRNGRLLATADMSGLVQVWNGETKEKIFSAESSDIEWLSWHSMTDAVLVGTADGAVWMWRVPSGECKIYQGPDCPCTCGKISTDGTLLISGYGDGSIRVWDLRAVKVLYSTSGIDLHQGSVTSLDVHKDSNLAITSSEDGTAKLVNIHSYKIIRTLDMPEKLPNDQGDNNENDEKGLESARFCPIASYIALGGLDGRLVIWDLNTNAVRCTCDHGAGIVASSWDPREPVIYTCTLDGVVRKWDARTGQERKRWTGHQAEILALQLAGDYVITTSDDGTARVFDVTAS